jgi:hypothetical protein
MGACIPLLSFFLLRRRQCQRDSFAVWEKGSSLASVSVKCGVARKGPASFGLWQAGREGGTRQKRSLLSGR